MIRDNELLSQGRVGYLLERCVIRYMKRMQNVILRGWGIDFPPTPGGRGDIICEAQWQLISSFCIIHNHEGYLVKGQKYETQV